MTAAVLEIQLVDLADSEAPLEQLEARLALLSDDETGVARRETPPAAALARQPLAGYRRTCRIALRAILLANGASNARGHHFSYDAHGKPSLGGCPLSFSVAHSGSIALIVVARSGPVGIDLERPRNVALSPPRRALIEAAGMALSPSSIDAAGFLPAWTRLEAFAKARGSGIGTLLTDLGITARGVATAAATPETAAERGRALLHGSGLMVRPVVLPRPLTGAICGPAGTIPDKPIATPFTAADRSFIG